MTQWVYIIQSECNGRYYCGQSADVALLLIQHNDPIDCLTKPPNNMPDHQWFADQIHTSKQMRP